MNARIFAYVLGAVLLGIAALSAGWIFNRFIHTPTEDASISADSAVTAPDFTLMDQAGQPRSLSDWRGKVVLLNFWATWCAPCVKEMPMLVELQDQYGAQGFQVLGITMDKPDPAAAFAEKLKINYPLLGNHYTVVDVQDAYGENRLPYSVLINRAGQVLWEYPGELDRATLEPKIINAVQ